MKKCIINTEDKEIIDFLTGNGYKCIPVVPSDKVSGPICAHSDVLYRKVGADTIIVSDCQKANFACLEDSEYKVIVCDKLSAGYKTESFLNFIINDRFVIRNPQTALNLRDEYIADKKIINVKQGYTSCSVIQVTEQAYITDDDNIYDTLTNNNLDCLKIKKGDIHLKGYDYGFIGGASVKLDENRILFFGDISDKTDKNNVISFLEKYGVNALFVSGKRLTDIGSALIL